MLRSLIASYRAEFKNTVARPMVQVSAILQPVVTATIAAFVLGDGARTQAVTVVWGSGLAGVLSVLVFTSAGSIERERGYGTLQPVFLSPAPYSGVLLAKLVADGTIAVFSLAVGVMYSAFVLGFTIPIPSSWLTWILAVVGFVIGGLGVSLSLSGLFFVSRSSRVLENVLEWPLLLFSGALVPLGSLPFAARIPAMGLPLAWFMDGFRASFDGQVKGESFALGFSLTAAYLVIGTVVMRVVSRRVRVSGSISLD